MNNPLFDILHDPGLPTPKAVFDLCCPACWVSCTLLVLSDFDALERVSCDCGLVLWLDVSRGALFSGVPPGLSREPAACCVPNALWLEFREALLKGWLRGPPSAA